MPGELTSYIFNIQRYSVHDGSGIRTLVFIKGCPLKCIWCSNPEGQSFSPQLGYVKNKCAGDQDCRRHPCIEACSKGAVREDQDGKILVDRDLCDQCGHCAEVCLWGALKMIGEEMTVTTVMKQIERDVDFYIRSGGGITVGGGEPLTSPQFVCRFLKECKRMGLNTAIETSGFTQWENLDRVLPHIDMVYFDIKHLDNDHHKAATGVSNTPILENVKRLLEKKPKSTVIRVPLIPEFNADKQQIRAIAGFVKDAGGRMMELLPYHHYGKSKYEQIGKEYALYHLSPLEDETVETLRKMVVEKGLKEITGLI